MSSVINYDWIDNKINKVKQKDIKYNEQVMGLADNIFWDYIKEFPNEYGKLVCLLLLLFSFVSPLF